MRQLAAFEEKKEELEALGTTIYAVSVDSLDQAREVGRGITFPVAYGATRKQSDQIGAWWEEKRGFIQPAEFLLSLGGVVLGSVYASGPLGRMDAQEVVWSIAARERRREREESEY